MLPSGLLSNLYILCACLDSAFAASAFNLHVSFFFSFSFFVFFFFCFHAFWSNAATIHALFIEQ